MAEPGLENRRCVTGELLGLSLGRRRQPERLRDLGDVQNRNRRVADEERGDDRSAGCLPPPPAFAVVANVQRRVLDTVLAKELPGRSAACSGRMPEEDR
jgi:hypothetical protein